MKLNILFMTVLLATGLLTVADTVNPTIYKSNLVDTAGTSTGLTIVSEQFDYGTAIPNTNYHDREAVLQNTESKIDGYISVAGKWYKIYDSGDDIGYYAATSKGSNNVGINGTDVKNVIGGSATAFDYAQSWQPNGATLSGSYENWDGSYIFNIKKITGAMWWNVKDCSFSFTLMIPLKGKSVTQTEYENGPTIVLTNPATNDSDYPLLTTNSVIEYRPVKGTATDTKTNTSYEYANADTLKPNSNNYYLGYYKNDDGVTYYVTGM